ncbi:MAG: CHASE2 domain-containing protein, partial [Cyanothece sp. SIO2G6]|nr:CHASE2 domain-containing protein [Cyanothece sp. SIO2G6]
KFDGRWHQILINYRATEQIAETVTLQQVLSGQFDPSRVKDRIVLVGVIAPTFNDHDWFTPYSSGGRNPRRMAGIEIQAHMTSQIISSALDGRPLLWSWSDSLEMLWIGTWTVGASVIAMRWRSRRYLTVVLGGMVMVLGGTCWLFICYGGWIPFVPVAIGIVGAGVGVNIYRGAIGPQHPPVAKADP